MSDEHHVIIRQGVDEHTLDERLRQTVPLYFDRFGRFEVNVIIDGRLTAQVMITRGVGGAPATVSVFGKEDL